METIAALGVATGEGNPPVTGGFPTQKPVTRNFYVLCHVHPNKRLSKQSICLWFELIVTSL